MMDQSARFSTCACLLLLVLQPLVLAQSSSDCIFSYLPHIKPSLDWPECLLDKLTRRLNGTLYIRPEGSEIISCPGQPCLTLDQLRDEYFAPNLGFNEAIPIGDTSLVFLPGIHTLKPGTTVGLDFIRVGEYTTVSLMGYNQNQPAVIHCETNPAFFLSNFRNIVVMDLWLEKCTVSAWQVDVLLVNNVVFNTSFLDVRFAYLVTMSNSSMTIESDAYCDRVELYGVFHSNSSSVTISNATFSFKNFECDDPKLLNINNGSLDISDSVFSGIAVLIVLRKSTLNVSGMTQFQDGNNAILSLSSIINLAGNVSFINNTGYQGGALSLSDSFITIADNAHVIFQGNHADYVGGAIFDSGSDILNYVSIAQTIGQHTLDSCKTTFGDHSIMEFVNNTAQSGGSAMYGITVSKLACSNGHMGYDALSDVISLEPDDFSAVSSNPLRVCICPDQSTPDCLAILPDQNISHLHYTVYPGETFTIPTAVVGFNFALTSGSVYAQFLDSDASLGSESQYVQENTHTGCSHLQYSVSSSRHYETLVLTANRRNVAGIPNSILRDIQVLNENEGYFFFDFSSYNYVPNPNKYYTEKGFATDQTDGVFRLAGHVPRPLQDAAVFISLTLLDCPPGFALSNESFRCVCDERLLEHKLTCNITDQTVHREGTVWINASFSGNTSNGVLVHQHCPFDYCIEQPLDIDLVDPDTQCAFNRSGTLCGACKPNFYLALGGSQCLPNCPNTYLSLVLPFALAGFALVFFIKILNLTVSQGTINGLIFYANIVAANRSIFFPTHHNKFLSFLSVFISWLNLDLGIETCFITGLDGYWKTWLQFVFPLYVWTIAGAIILASRYSTWATKIFGENSVSVLATLFLFSFIKLLPFIVTIFGFATLVYPDDSTSLIWAFEGNVQYLNGKYIPLFLFALALVVLLGLPYIAILVSAQWLRTQTHHKGLRWLKPFLDAYYGPFKDKHHYWVGVLLLVRGVLFIIFARFIAAQSNVNLLLTIITSILLTTYLSITGTLYKKVYLSALENSFFLNLGVLATGTLYIRLVNGSQEALVTTSVGIAFLQFVGITTFHIYAFIFIPLRKRYKAEWNTYKQPYGHELSTTFVVENEEVTHTEFNMHNDMNVSASLQENHSTSRIIPIPHQIGNSTPFKTTDHTPKDVMGPVNWSEAAANNTTVTAQEHKEPLQNCGSKKDFESAMDFSALREPLLSSGLM